MKHAERHSIGQTALCRTGLMMKVFAALAGLFCGLFFPCVVASAGWQIETVENHMPDNISKRGFVTAMTGNAMLRLDCVNGAQLLSINVDRDLARGMIGSSITFDDGKPVSLLLQVFSNPRNVPLFDVSPKEVMRARRLRIELQPTEGQSVSYEFETSGGKTALKAVLCGPKGRSLLRRFSR
jgi:hypothetical protein